MSVCWKCGKALELADKKIPFRATCEHCHAWLHVCRNCIHYKPGMRNDCEVPDTEFVPDRSVANFCEDFSLLGKQVDRTSDVKDVTKRLFGE